MNYIKVSKAAEKWGISTRRVRLLCSQGKIDGVIRNGYPPINVKFTDRKRYYDAFDAFYKNGDPTAMTDLLAEYVDLRFDDYFAVLENDN